MFVVVVGAIDYWWNENWHTPAHLEYIAHRDDVCKKLVAAGHLVYRPHEAFKGAWDERGQAVNDAAIDNCDIMINVTPQGVPAYGTEAEIERFFRRVSFGPDRFSPGERYFHAPPGKLGSIAHLIISVDDPYSNVYRKSYTKKDK